MTMLSAFDTTVQKTMTWIHELGDAMHWDEQKSYLCMRATLHALRDRLTVDEAVQLGAQLPMLLRGLFFEGWKPRETPIKVRNREDFFQMVRMQLPPGTHVSADAVVCSVFGLLSRKISRGEIQDVRGMMPADLAELWPEGDAGGRTG